MSERIKDAVQMTDEQHAAFMAEVRRHHAELARLTAEHVEASKQMVYLAANPKPPVDLRDWFAGQALAGMCGKAAVSINLTRDSELAYELADAMLEARK